MGWIGWSEEVALETTASAILLAYDGRQDMLKAIFGSSEPKEADKYQEINKNTNLKGVPKDAHGKPIVLTPTLFDRTFIKPKKPRVKTMTKPKPPIIPPTEAV